MVGWVVSDGRTGVGWTRAPSPAIPEPRVPSRAAPTSCPRSAASPPRAASAALREGRRPGAQPRGVAAGGRARQSRTCSSLWAVCGWVRRAQTTPPRRHCSELSGSSPRPCLRSGRLALKGTRPEWRFAGWPRFGLRPVTRTSPLPPPRIVSKPRSPRSPAAPLRL